MLDRRVFAGLLGAAALPLGARAATGLPFYASTGPVLSWFDLDVGAATLTRRGSVSVPANLQYAWPHPSGKVLYVCASNSQPPSGPAIGGVGSDKNHYAIAYAIASDGALSEFGERRLLSHRPLHLTTDGRFLFIAYNSPAEVTVHRLNADGSIGEPVAQPAGLDFGIYAHQVRVSPKGTVTLCSRGNDATASKPEDPGHIEVFRVDDGRLANLQSLAPHDQGLGFGPRHLDFSPDGRFVFVSLERQNSICVYALNADGSLGADPLFIRNALEDPDGKATHPGQTAGPIHVHPGGHFVYQTNRGSGTTSDAQGRKVWNGGENSIAVWKIDPRTGEPTRIQNAPAHGFELRTFTIDPSGTLLIAAAMTPLMLPDGTMVSAGYSLYRIGADGKLAFVRKIDADTTAGAAFWCGLLNMP
jgi:6-phosphogluconolactonase (cycloisomerase 2 family)